MVIPRHEILRNENDHKTRRLVFKLHNAIGINVKSCQALRTLGKNHQRKKYVYQIQLCSLFKLHVYVHIALRSRQKMVVATVTA